MTPANDPNGKPFIYRIADALGITHLVVAVQHSHLMSEVSGLEAALAAKADEYHTHSVISEGENAINVGEGYVNIDLQEDEAGAEVDITIENLPNLARALEDPDTTPTANSDNLVTSGGVKDAIDNIINPSSRQIILTKTADGYQFASAESELAEFVNRITSWTGESVPTIITCVVITNDGTEGMPAILTYSSTSRYIDFRINIATYRLEGQIMIDEETYSSDMLMELTDMSYVFAE